MGFSEALKTIKKGERFGETPWTFPVDEAISDIWFHVFLIVASLGFFGMFIYGLCTAQLVVGLPLLLFSPIIVGFFAKGVSGFRT